MFTYEQRGQWYDAKHQIKRLVSMPDLLHEERVKVRGRNRADCPFCQGSQRGTMSFTRELFKCHRCGAGGDIFSFLELTQGGDFKRALEYAACMARVELQTAKRLSPEERRQWAAEQAERKRQEVEIDDAVEYFAAQERATRLECRDLLHHCDEVLNAPGPWCEADWQRATAAHALREFLLAEYTLLSFASGDQRLEYLRASEAERVEMLVRVRWRNGVEVTTSDESDKFPFVQVIT
jgi:hypothetical protein